MIDFRTVHAYHYCALRGAGDGTLNYKHGIAHTASQIIDIGGYDNLLQDIVGKGANTYGWAITSLTYHGQVNVRMEVPKPGDSNAAR